MVMLGAKAFGELAHRSEIGEVQGHDLNPSPGRGFLNLAGRSFAPDDVSARHQNMRAGASQLASRDQAQSAVGTRDYRSPSVLVGNLLGSPLRAHRRSSAPGD
jgi:hypothetical protein